MEQSCPPALEGTPVDFLSCLEVFSYLQLNLISSIDRDALLCFMDTYLFSYADYTSLEGEVMF